MTIDTQSLDSQANRHTIKCLVFTSIAFFIIWILTLTGIFIVDKKLMTLTFLSGSAIMLLPLAACRFTGTEKSWIKYLILADVCIALAVIGTMLTFHAVLLFALPLFYAAQYSNRRMIYYAYLMTTASLFASVMLGYYFGICDANMLLLSNHPTDYYVSLFFSSDSPIYTNPSPWTTLPLYFVLPRSIILMAFVPAIRHISNCIAKNAVTTAELLRLSETDKMTQFFNKGKYDQMITEYYPGINTVGVIFWDINNLKKINDTFGHFQGDNAISAIAGCILSLTAEHRKAYRVGGDEFVMILENPKDKEMACVISDCRQLLESKNQMSTIPLSVSVGCAAGKGTEIHALIRQADQSMYRNKKQFHSRDRKIIP